MADKSFELLSNAKASAPPPLTRGVLALEQSLRSDLQDWLSAIEPTTCIRVHGDLHLGQVLVADGDFVIIDFEGEPGRPAAQRRRKRTPLVDVAGMIRSLHYAAVYGALDGPEVGAAPHSERLLAVAEAWWQRSSAQYLRGYLAVAGDGGLLAPDACQLELQLHLCIIEKVLYEIRYELNHRPQWVSIPMRGLLAALRQPFHAQASSG